jgi:DNA-binding transcriptional ArsR family regulator
MIVEQSNPGYTAAVIKEYQHPSLSRVTLPEVMQALSDPVRIGIVRRLLEAGEGTEFACNEFPMRLSKATRSHHFQVLRDAGLIRTRVEGTKCMSSLRRGELQKRFPGLLGMIENSK